MFSFFCSFRISCVENQDDDDQKVAVMRKAFQMFDTAKTGFIETMKIATILNTMGQLFDDTELQALIDENDPNGESIAVFIHELFSVSRKKNINCIYLVQKIQLATGKVNFEGFTGIAGHFFAEEEDAEAMQQELKEAFRLYDREGNGYITTSTLKEILAALDDKLNNADLDGIIAEIDTDGSGTVDFDGKLQHFLLNSYTKYHLYLILVYILGVCRILEFMEMMTGD